MDDLADETLQFLSFYIFATKYHKERTPRFTDITDLELTAEPVVVDNFGQVVTDFKEKVVKKKNKYVTKKKEQLAKFCALIGSLMSSCPKSSPFLLPHSLPTPITIYVFHLRFATVLLSCHMPAPIFCSGSLVVLLSCRVSAFIFCAGSLAILLSCHLPALATSAAFFLSCHASVSCCGISALLWPLYVLGSPLFLASSLLRTFKQSLSDKP